MLHLVGFLLIQGIINFSMEKGNENHQLGTGFFFVHHGIVSPVRRGDSGVDGRIILKCIFRK